MQRAYGWTRPTTTVTTTMAPSIRIMRLEKVLENKVEALNTAACKPDSHAWIFLVLMGKTQLDGFTKLKNSFSIREPNQRRRCSWHLFICKMKPCSGTNGMSSCNQTCNGRNLLEPCASILGLPTMKILMKL